MLARGSSPREEQTRQQPYRQLCRNAAVGAGGQTGTEAWRRQRPTLNNQATGKTLGLHDYSRLLRSIHSPRPGAGRSTGEPKSHTYSTYYYMRRITAPHATTGMRKTFLTRGTHGCERCAALCVQHSAHYSIVHNIVQQNQTSRIMPAIVPRAASREPPSHPRAAAPRLQ